MFSELCYRTDVLASVNYERMSPLKNNYIANIEKLLPHADAELLDFIFQVLQKSIPEPVNVVLTSNQQTT